MEAEKSKDIDESGTHEVNKSLKRKEIACDAHAETPGEYFCSQELKVFCEKCKHSAGCCEESKDIKGDVDFHLRLLREKPQLPADLRLKLGNIAGFTAQACYQLLRAWEEQKKQPQVRLCSAHQTMQAEGIHKLALTLGCQKCISVENWNYIRLESLEIGEFVGYIRVYLRRVHCYLVPVALLAKLAGSDRLEVNGLLEFAGEIRTLPTSNPEIIPQALYCPKCLTLVPRLLRLNCFGACHGLCTTCVSEAGPTGIKCPLDGNIYQSLSGDVVQYREEEKCQGMQGNGTDSDMEVPEGLSTVTSVVRSWPHWKGTSLPPPSITGRDVKVLQRFLGLYPPVKASKSELRPAMSPWKIDQSSETIEAFVFTVSDPLVLIGLTVASPISRDIHMLVDQVQIRLGNSMDAPVLASPFASAKEVFNVTLAADFQFDTPVGISANTPYTLSLKLRTPNREPLIVYKGNQTTAQEYLSSDGVELWSFEQPIARGKILNGDNHVSGPILRLFYRV